MPSRPLVILIAGYDYARAAAQARYLAAHGKPLADRTTRFRKMCERRTKQLYDANTDFLLFDVGAGKALGAPNSRGFYTSEESGHPWRPIAFSTDYDDPNKLHPQFIATDGLVLPITDIYDRIRRLESGQLARLEYFGHSAPFGPILVNSSQRPSYNWNEQTQNTRQAYTLRDPLDRDGRSYKDFNIDMGLAPGQGSLVKNGVLMSALDAFKDSFAPNAEVILWGCSREHDLFKGMMEDAWKYLAAGRPSSDLSALHDFKRLGDGQTVQYSLATVAGIAKIANGVAYGGQFCMALAKSGVLFHVSLSGTGAELDGATYDPRGGRFMHVPVNLDEETEDVSQNDDASKVLEAYSQLIPGIETDDRNYGMLTIDFLNSSGIYAAAQQEINRRIGNLQ